MNSENNADNPRLLLGAHFSVSKGLDRALYDAQAYNCTAAQMFTKNAQTWKERSVSDDEIAAFEQAKEKTGIREIASHTSYLINLAAPDKKKHAMSRRALKQELIRSSLLGIPYVVLHPGSHLGKGEKQGINLISESVNKILDQMTDMKTRLLLETTAGQGTGLGHTFEQLAQMINHIRNKERIGICLDTCHIFAAGYDIRTETAYQETMETFDSVVGLGNLYLIHLNDSKKDLGSKVDRHENIGEGYIGSRAFGYIMNDQRLSFVPKVIETPKDKTGSEDWDKMNLEKLRSLTI